MSLTALAPGDTRERSLTWFDWSLLADISPDGKTIIFSETGEAEGTNYSMFLRKTDGSPAIRLGDGGFGALSPDGQWVVSIVGFPAKLMLLPTGVGEPRQLTDGKSDNFAEAWLPDSKSIVFSSVQSGQRARSYLLDIQGGKPRALTPEGTTGARVTPDGKYLLARDERRQLWLYPIAAGEAQKLNFSLSADEVALGFSADGKNLLTATHGVPLRIALVDLATGRRQPWKEIAPADLAGVLGISTIKFSADGKSYAYSTLRVLSDLYVVDGLK